MEIHNPSHPKPEIQPQPQQQVPSRPNYPVAQQPQYVQKTYYQQQQYAPPLKPKKKFHAWPLIMLAIVIGGISFFIAMRSMDSETGVTVIDASGQTIITTKAASKDAIQLNQTISANGFSFNAVEIKRSAGSILASPSDGNVFISVKFIIENTSSQNKSLAYLAPIFESYADNTKCLLSPTGQFLFGNVLNGDLAPGMRMEGYHVIEAPAGARVLTLELGVLYRDNEVKKFILEIPQG